MADIANAAVLASVIVGMVSIPAASGSIDTGSSVPDPVEDISSTQEIPKQESTELGTDSFTRVVETAFSEIRTEVSSGEVDGEYETPRSRLELDRSPGKVEWTMNSPQGKLTVIQESDRVVERTETPHGTLEKVRKDGAVRTSFEGSNREKVEERAQELRDLMEQKKQKYQSKTDRMRIEQYRKNLDLDVAPETPEKAVIENSMDERIDLQGWRLANNNPDYYELNQTLGEGRELHVYTAEKDEIEVEEKDSHRYVYGSDLTWEDGGDTAKLFDSEGNEVESHSY